MDWSPAAAISAALGFLVVFWLSTTPSAVVRPVKTATPSSARWCFVVVCVASWLACQLFAGRAAFLLVGAMIATAMSANVFFWIIPASARWWRP
jgi:uncharacterized membrane protein